MIQFKYGTEKPLLALQFAYKFEMHTAAPYKSMGC